MIKGACFIDADNISSPQDTEWGEELTSLLDSSCRVRRAFGAGKTQSATLSKWLFTHSFNQINAYSPVSGKNTADIQMTLAIAETALSARDEGPMRFIIVTGDSDFAPVLQKLFEWGHELCLVARPGHLLSAASSLGARTIMISPPDADVQQAAASEAPPPSVNRLLKACAETLSGQGPLKLVHLAHALHDQLGAKWYQRMGHKKLADALQGYESLLLTKTANQDYLVEWRDSPPQGSPEGQPSIERLGEVLNGLYQLKESYVLPQLHDALCRAYPEFSYQAYGHKKFKSFIVQRFPHLRADSNEPSAPWYVSTGHVTRSLDTSERYRRALNAAQLSPVMWLDFVTAYRWPKDLNEFTGLSEVAARGAQALELPQALLQAVIKALYHAKLFTVVHSIGQAPRYSLTLEAREAYAMVKAALRAHLNPLEPLDEPTWEGLWEGSAHEGEGASMPP